MDALHVASPSSSMEERVRSCPRLIASFFVLVGCVVGGLMVALGVALGHRDQSTPSPSPQFIAQDMNKWPVLSAPTNVNFGGWLCLEDWFYSGSFGTDVSTVNDLGQGACLPPSIPGPLEEPWPSEGILVHREVKSKGPAATIESFRQHRESFISAQDLDDVKSLGVQIVRVPLTWAAFADALITINASAYGGFDPEIESAIVPDPFYYENASLVTIPRNFLAQFIRNCSARGFKVLLDLHAFPSGSSQGTYNGIYPLKPVFWWNNTRIGKKPIALTDVGLWIVKKLISWVEGLDADVRAGVAGITVMNEPGHQLASTLDPQKLLDWIARAADVFRTSYLPERGVKLYVNLIDTAIHHFDEVVQPWWEATFSEAERNLWAVMDIHNYLAWLDSCEGHPANVSGGGYKCDDSHSLIRKVLQGCLEPFVKNFAKRYKGLRACTEFSLSTSSVVAHACSKPEVLKEFLSQQVNLLKGHGIEPFFWTFKMPYGPKFEPGWSYQFHAGLAKPPSFQCHPPKHPNSSRHLGHAMGPRPEHIM